MTTYILSLRTLGGDEAEPNPALTTLADLRTTDPAVMAATLRAVADRLDPPRPAPAGPVYRDATRRAAGDQRFRERLAGYDVEEADARRADGKAPGTTRSQ